VLSAIRLFFVVFSVLQSGTYGWISARQDLSVFGVVLVHECGVTPVWALAAIGALFLVLFVVHTDCARSAVRHRWCPSGCSGTGPPTSVW
jgi:hypothetical protein